MYVSWLVIYEMQRGCSAVLAGGGKSSGSSLVGIRREDMLSGFVFLPILGVCFDTY